jgi:hypothetical protein
MRPYPTALANVMLITEGVALDIVHHVVNKLVKVHDALSVLLLHKRSNVFFILKCLLQINVSLEIQ